MKKLLTFVSMIAVMMMAGESLGATVRLVYGEKWSPSGRAVKKTLESQAWKSLAKSKFKCEFVDEETGRSDPLNLGSIKLPVIFVLDDKGRCYCVIEGVPQKASAEWIYKQVSRATELREEIEKKYGGDSVEAYGQLMSKMERFVGGPNRVISKGYYEDVFEKLKRADPNDESGWLRHFTMPFVDHEGKQRRCNHADGVEIVEEATWYRKEKRIADGERFIEEQKKLPRKHLTKEQTQALLIAQFALYAPEDMNKPWESPKKAEMVKLLQRVAVFDDETLWGTAALGWLACPAINEPPLSTYWGWRRGDIPQGKFETSIKYGVVYSFSQPGEYTISFDRTDGAAITVDSVTLNRVSANGTDEVAKLTRSKAQDPFVVKIERGDAGKINEMVIRGNSGGESAGKIIIKRTVLKPRKESK